MGACVAPETSAETSPVVRMPQPNGGYLTAGNPGNKGGGRTPDYIRRLARRNSPEAIRTLREIMRGVTVEFQDGGQLKLVTAKPEARVSASKAIIEAGMGPATNMADVREKLTQQAVVIRQVLKPEDAEALFAALRGVWR